MRVILKQNVENLGRKGDIVVVAPGYGRNFLIPRKIALEVTPSNLKMIEIEQQALKKELEKERASYQDLIEKLNATSLSFKRKAGEKDVIFGSVSAGDIKDALQEQGFDIDKKKILLDEPIKRLGNYTVAIKIFHEDRAEVKVGVLTEEGEEKEQAVGEEPVDKEEAKVKPDEEKKEEIEGKKEEGEDEEGVKSKEETGDAEEVLETKEEKTRDTDEEKKEEASGPKEEKEDTPEGPEEEEEKAQKKEGDPAEKTEAEEKEKPEAKGKKERKDKKEKKKRK